MYLSHCYPRELSAEICSTYHDVLANLKSYMGMGANVGIVG